MSSKLISIVFIPLAIIHQSLCGQNMSLVTYTYLSQTYRARFGCPLSACLSSLHPLPVQYMFLYTFNSYSLHYIVFSVFPIWTRRIQHFSSVRYHHWAIFLRSCFQSQLTFRNLEFQIHHTLWTTVSGPGLLT